MKDKLEYKGLIGSASFSPEDLVFHGKIEGIDGLVTFEGESVSDLKTAFEEAVEDYIEICQSQTGTESKPDF